MPEFGLPDPLPQTVVAVHAHPDDTDVAAGGTIALLAEAGVRVVYVIVTDGSVGGWDRELPRSEIVALRVSEQENAAAKLGVQELVWLQHPDGAIFDSVALRGQIVEVLRREQPELVITHSPDRNRHSVAASHPDHLAVGAATLAAVYPDARNPFQHTEQLDAGLEPWAVPAVWLTGDAKATRIVEIDVVLDQKLTAVRAHVSQNPPGDGLVHGAEAWGAAIALAAGLETGHHCEAFEELDTR
jgi:LmbE family N-acetylglucosaminyl deacetylase